MHSSVNSATLLSETISADYTMSSARIRETVGESLFEALSSSHEVQQKVLEILVSITKVSPQNRNLLAQTDGAIPALLTLSKSSSSIIQAL
ncbi:hypothetical protein CFP56_043661 [Quercus suber]|uniref:Uncharacterized protein n=1 Tax=Quercus suber TaxID=58331 RepID=A0AAW0LK99_QUESU